MQELLDNYDGKKLRTGDVVEGEIVQVTEKTVYVAIPGQATEGVMHLDHYTKDKSVTTFVGLVNVGDKIECTVAKAEFDGNVYLSRLNQVANEAFKEIVKAKEENATVTVKLVADANGKGFNCKLQGYNAFLPKSQAPRDAKVGDELEVKITELEESRKNIVVSRRVIEQAELEAKRAEAYEKVNVGDVVMATVAKVEKYGAILRFGDCHGLMKVGQYAHTFTKDITAEIKPGDQFEVKVIVKNNGKFELSRKELLDTPFNAFAKEHKVSDEVTGKVAAKLAFGLLIEVAPDVKALLHSSEYSHNPNDNYANCVVIGDEVTAKIIKMDPANEKISLSRKACIDNPWDKVDARRGDTTTVTVTAVKDAGLEVAAFGVDGFVPASQVAGNVSDYSVGDTANAVVIEINPREWRLKLSIRDYAEREERKSYEKYLNSDDDATTTIGDVANLK